MESCPELEVLLLDRAEYWILGLLCGSSTLNPKVETLIRLQFNLPKNPALIQKSPALDCLSLDFGVWGLNAIGEVEGEVRKSPT